MPSRSRVLAIVFAVLLVGVAMARHSALMFGKFVHGNLSNPDSYYNLVALLDGWANGQFPFIARDNAPHGVWMHWTLPYSWTLWQLHWPLAWLGVDDKQALLYAGGVLTLLCMLLVTWFVALSVLRCGTRRAAMVSGLVLATSLPLMGYASIATRLPITSSSWCLWQPQRPACWGCDRAGNGF